MKGNKGGKSHNDRKLAAKVRTLALNQIADILEGDDEAYKKQIILKMSSTILPRLNEHTGEDGGELKINLINYGDSTTIPFPTEELPATIS